MVRKAKRANKVSEAKRPSEVRKAIIDLQNMENKEEQFEMACQFAERVHDPPLTKEEFEVFCEICEIPGFIKILFPEK